MEFGLGSRDDGLAVTRDGEDAELLKLARLDGGDEFPQGHIHDRGVFVEFEDRNLQLAPCEVHRVCGGTVFEEGGDFVGGYPLGINQQLDTQLLEQQSVFGGEELLVVDARGDLRCPDALGEQGCDKVDLLGRIGVDGDEKIGLSGAGLLECLD